MPPFDAVIAAGPVGDAPSAQTAAVVVIARPAQSGVAPAVMSAPSEAVRVMTPEVAGCHWPPSSEYAVPSQTSAVVAPSVRRPQGVAHGAA